MKKIGVFLGDFFWSSIPYDGLPLYNLLSEHYETDLIMFDDDIRLNKKFQGHEKFYFNPEHFRNCNLKTVANWDHFYEISSNYELILTSVHIAPKTRLPYSAPVSSSWTSFSPDNKIKKIKIAQCPVAVWDAGGADVLANPRIFSDFIFVKGPIWKDWLVKMGENEDNVFVTGSPHYDNYLDEFLPFMPEPILNKKEFNTKYQLSENSTKILIMPCNPGSHKEYFEENMEQLEKIYRLAEQYSTELLVKTYPHDYIYNETEEPYTGIYRRVYTDKPQYQFIKDHFPSIKIIESQDHFSAMKYCDKLFNISGSHIAWETYFAKTTSYSLGYENQPYYKNLPYLPDYISFPDDLMNIHMDDLTDIVHKDLKTEKDKCSDWFLNEVSIPNIVDAVKQIIGSE